MKYKFVILLCLVATVFCKLEFVLEISRHGIRTPQALYNFTADPKDNFKITYELTEMGMRQHYLVGNQVRKRYVDDLNFISGDFNNSEILFRSTNTTRTIESGISQMLGIFQPKFCSQTLNTFQQKNALPPIDIENIEYLIEELKEKALPNCFNLAPIFSKKMANCYDISIDDSDCPNYYKVISEVEQTDAYKQLKGQYTSILIPRFKAYLGRDVQENEIADLCEYLTMADHHKMKLIFNYTEDDVNQCELFHHTNMYKIGYGDDRLWKIGVKGFFEMIIDRMDKIINKNQTHKMELIFSHDQGINNILNGIGYLCKITPPLASTLFFELHNDDGEYYVTATYNDLPLTYGLCTDIKCKYSTFKENAKQRSFPGTIEDACFGPMFGKNEISE